MEVSTTSVDVFKKHMDSVICIKFFHNFCVLIFFAELVFMTLWQYIIFLTYKCV